MQHRRDATIAVAAVLKLRGRRCRRSAPLRHRWSSGSCVASSDAGRELGRRSAPTRRAWRRPDRRKHDDGLGSEVSRGGFLQDQLLQREIRHRSSKTQVLGLEILQPLDLVALQAAVLLSPPVVRDLGHLDRAHRLRRPVCLARPTHRPAVTWRRSPPPCGASWGILKSSSWRKAIHQGGPLLRGQTTAKYPTVWISLEAAPANTRLKSMLHLSMCNEP